MTLRRVDKPKVALLIETSGGYGRSFLAGVARYARLHGPWSFYILPRGHEQVLPDMKQWGGTGIIARVRSRKVAAAIAAAEVPAIGLDLAPEVVASMPPGFRPSEIHPDSQAIARLAAEHLFERGFAHFAFVGVRDRIWSQERHQAFSEYLLRTRGYACTVFTLSEVTRTARFSQDQQRLGAWLKQQPKPLGLMSCNDDCGREVLDAALQVGLSVPDEMAVVGVDNDEVLCELCDPPLSSVALNAEKGGYEAASLLDSLMAGRSKKARRLVVQPLGVVARRSTEVWAVADRNIARALQFIRDHAHEPIGVSDVLRLVPMSRRALEVRFRQVARRSIHDEIIAARLRLAQKLLRETDLTLEAMAERCGFGSASHMSVVFAREVGLAPAQYRKRVSST